MTGIFKFVGRTRNKFELHTVTIVTYTDGLFQSVVITPTMKVKNFYR